MVNKDKSMLSKLWISAIAILVVGVVIYFLSGERIRTPEPLGIHLKPGASATDEQIEKERAKAEERIAELSARIESRQPLQETMQLLSYARDMRSIPVFREILMRNPRGVNRAAAVISLTVVEEGTQTGEAIPFLIRALKDPDTDVRLRAALGLIRLGRTEEPVEVLYRIALADDIKDWQIDWEGYFGTSEMETNQWKVKAAEFKNGMRVYAINGLGSIGTERTYALIRDVMEKKGNQAYFRGGQLMTYKDYIEKTGILNGSMKGVNPPVW